MKKCESLLIYSLILILNAFTLQPAFGQVVGDWQEIGTLKSRSADEINSSNWLVGCETLDRDYADYDAYKAYLVPLGIKRIRLQAGWAKIEKVKGVYDFAWLDHIINDALSRGLKPWLQLSYGNPIYAGGGGANLSAGLPQSAEALTAWDNWTKATVEHYKNKVVDWEVWNEPNNIRENKPEQFADLTARTITIIKLLQPDARISALALGWIDVDFADKTLVILAAKNILKSIDNITYHGYCKNPDNHYPDVERLRAVLAKYDKHLKLRQGENGAPSRGNMGGAISDYDWTELSQAKWDTRRMLGDLGRDIESSVFTIIDIAYNTDGPIKKLNVKGLLSSDSTKKVKGVKQAYRAVQHITAIFDDQLQRIRKLDYTSTAPDTLAVYGYQNKFSGEELLTVWKNTAIPENVNHVTTTDIIVKNGKFTRPVYVDIISGKIFEIPRSQWRKNGSTFEFFKVPVYDAPILITDASNIRYVR